MRSRTRRLIDVETHRQVFTWVLQLLAKQGLLKGGTIAVDATTLEANAALRSIRRRIQTPVISHVTFPFERSLTHSMRRLASKVYIPDSSTSAGSVT